VKTDRQLQHDVLAELEWEPSVDAAHIGVTAADGVVTLTGKVPALAQKLAAEEVAKRVNGVKAVANDIEVHIPDKRTLSDSKLAAAAVSALEWNAMVPHESVTVAVRDGWITLEGAVDWQYQKEAAGQAVRSLAGARGVTNTITVRPKTAAPAVKGRIEAALVRSASIDSKGIWVEADDGTAVLRGDVHSCYERDAAEQIAWAAPGVSRVENYIEITPW